METVVDLLDSGTEVGCTFGRLTKWLYLLIENRDPKKELPNLPKKMTNFYTLSVSI